MKINYKIIIGVGIISFVVIAISLYKTKPDMILNNYQEKKVDLISLFCLSGASAVFVMAILLLVKKYQLNDSTEKDVATFGFKWNYFNY